MACSGSSVSSAHQGVPYGGNAILGIGYGQGPYGGIQATGADMPTGQWFLPSTIFVAQQSTVMLSFQSIVGARRQPTRLSSGWTRCWSRSARQ